MILNEVNVAVAIVIKTKAPVDTIMIDGVLKTSAIIKVKTLLSQKILTKRTIFSDTLNFLK